MPPAERNAAATPWLAYLSLGASMALVGSYVGLVKLPIGAAAVGVGVLGETSGVAHGVALALAIAGVVLATGGGAGTGAGDAQRRAARP